MGLWSAFSNVKSMSGNVMAKKTTKPHHEVSQMKNLSFGFSIYRLLIGTVLYSI